MLNKEINDFIKIINRQVTNTNNQPVISLDSLLGETIESALLITPNDNYIHDVLDEDVIIVESSNPQAIIKKILVSTVCDGSRPGGDVYVDVYIIKGQNGKYCFSCQDSSEHLNLGQQLYYSLSKDHLKYIGRKTPKIAASMIDAKYEHFIPTQISTYYNKIINLKDLIKGTTYSQLCNLIKIDDLKKDVLVKMIGKGDKTSDINFLIKSFDPERLIDIFDHIREESKVTSFIKHITSNKDRELFTDKCEKYIREIIRIDVSESEFRAEFSKKIAKYKSTDEFEFSLKKYLDSKSGWCIDNWNKKLEKHNLTTQEIKDNIYLIEIDTFEQINALGSTQWCIATDLSDFDEYTKNYRRQYMVLNFNLEPEDSLSMIGLTANTKGEIIFAHDKNDSNIMGTDTIIDCSLSVKKLDEDILAKKIKSHHSGWFSIYKSFGEYNIKNHHMVECEQNIINTLSTMNIDDIQLSHLICIRNGDNGYNNISESIDLLKEALCDDDFKTLLTQTETRNIAQYTVLEDGNSLKKLLLEDFYPQDMQFIIFKEFCDYGYLNQDKNLLKLAPQFFEKYKENFWGIWDDMTVKMSLFNKGEEGDFFFSNSTLLDFFKDKNIPISTSSEGVFRFAQSPYIQDYFNTLDDSDKIECIKKFIDNKNLRNIFDMTKNNQLPLEKLTTLMQNSVHEDNYLDLLNSSRSYYELNRSKLLHESENKDQRHDTLFEAMLMGIIKNVDTIDLEKIQITAFLKNDELRNKLLENDMLIPSQYAEYASQTATFDKIGIPLVIHNLTSKDIKYEELDYVIGHILEHNIINKKELKEELKKHINFTKLPDFIMQKLNNNIQKLKVQ
jgi:hypothetical protein